ncbi:MAG: Methyl-accepting transducer protein [Pseudomonadota bacterium]|nr:Methyl-accepting transducer protein [Pseudomonadota bacterium]
MQHWKVASRLYLIVLAAGLALSGLTAAVWITLGHLGELQDASHRRAAEAGEMKRIAGLGERYYRIVADSIINHDLPAAARDWRELEAETERDLRAIETAVDTDQERRDAQAVRAAVAEMHRLYAEDLLPRLREEAPLETLRPLDALMDRQVEQIGTLLTRLSLSLEAEAREADEHFDRIDRQARQVMTGVSLLCGLVLVGLALKVARSILAQLGMEPEAAMELASTIARGDLTCQAPVRPASERSVAAALAVMLEQLQLIVHQVRSGAESVAAASEQIAIGNADLASRTEQQAGAIESTTSTVQALGQGVSASAGQTEQARQLVQEASQAAGRGHEAVDHMIRTMTGIAESSRRIADINAVVDGIAFQTNILALNASVEAARAGEQGRGFAVVAAEVRLLAQRSAEAAREIRALIEDSVRRVEAGHQLVGEAGQGMNAVNHTIGQLDALIDTLSSTSRAQSDSLLAIGATMGQMDSATQQNASLVEESATAAGTLRQQATTLVDLVSTFRLAPH